MSRATAIRASLIILFALALNISISGAEIAGGLLLLEWAARPVWDKRPAWKSSPLDIPLLCLAVWTAASMLLHRTATVREAISGQSALLLFFLVSRAFDDGEMKVLFRWFCIGGALTGFLGVLEYFLKVNVQPVEMIYHIPTYIQGWPDSIIHFIALRNDRAVGSRSHPLTYAECLLPSVVLFASFAVDECRSVRPSKKKIFWLAASFIFVAGGVIVSESRGVWLGLLVGFAVFAWLMGPKFFVRTALIGGILLALGLAVAPPVLRGRLTSIFSSSSGSLGDQQSKETRYTLWREALDQIKTHPLGGVGDGGVRLTSIDPISKQERIWTETHNLFLQFALELGLLGFGIFLWVLIVCGKIIDGAPAQWRPAFWGIFIAFLIAGMTECWLHDQEVAMIFWTFIGCADYLRTRGKT